MSCVLGSVQEECAGHTASKQARNNRENTRIVQPHMSELGQGAGLIVEIGEDRYLDPPPRLVTLSHLQPNAN